MVEEGSRKVGCGERGVEEGCFYGEEERVGVEESVLKRFWEGGCVEEGFRKVDKGRLGEAKVEAGWLEGLEEEGGEGEGRGREGRGREGEEGIEGTGWTILRRV